MTHVQSSGSILTCYMGGYAWDSLLINLKLALADAWSLALGHDNQFIEPLHLMSALLNRGGDRYVLY